MNYILFSMNFTQDELLNQDDAFSINCSLNNSEVQVMIKSRRNQ